MFVFSCIQVDFYFYRYGRILKIPCFYFDRSWNCRTRCVCNKKIDGIIAACVVVVGLITFGIVKSATKPKVQYAIGSKGQGELFSMTKVSIQMVGDI